MAISTEVVGDELIRMLPLYMSYPTTPTLSAGGSQLRANEVGVMLPTVNLDGTSGGDVSGKVVVTGKIALAFEIFPAASLAFTLMPYVVPTAKPVTPNDGAGDVPIRIPSR